VNSKRFDVHVSFMISSVLCTRHLLLGLRLSLDPLRGSPVPNDLKKSPLFVILSNFGFIFRGEEIQITKKPEDMLRRIVLAS